MEVFELPPEKDKKWLGTTVGAVFLGLGRAKTQENTSEGRDEVNNRYVGESYKDKKIAYLCICWARIIR